MKSHANAEYTVSGARANVPSCRGTCHIDTSVCTPMSKHSTRVPRSEFRRGGEKKKEHEVGWGGLNTRNSPGPLNPSGRASWRGHVSLSEDNRREVRAHASLRQNLMLMPVESRDRPRYGTTVRRHVSQRRRNDYTRDS